MECITIDAIQQIRNDDIIIAFMGPTGVGKSYFIDLLTGQTGKRAGGTLKSVTAKVQATRVKHPKYGDKVVFVDTPGFDDTTMSDMQILKLIGDWLTATYTNNVKLSGIIYLHRITDNRMAGSPYRNLRMFGNLCGDSAMARVVLVSTMWERINANLGAEREKQLCEQFWKGLIEKGSGVERLQPSDTGAAWRIVGKVIETAQKREQILFQEEIVDLSRQLRETEAGKSLYTTLQKQLLEQKQNLQALLAKVDKSADSKLRKQLEKECEKNQKLLEKTFQEVKQLKLPLGRRIMLYFFGKKARAKAVKIASVEV